jgi:Tfp pilus assembly protein PilF
MRWRNGILAGVGCAAMTFGGGCLAFLSPELMAPKATPVAANLESSVSRGATELSEARSAELSLAMARELERNGRNQEAVPYYERASAMHVDQPWIAHRLALLYDHAGDDEHAAAKYRAATEAEPRNADVWNDQGAFHYARGEWELAESDLRRATKLNPHHERAWGNLALVLAQQERYEESYFAFSKIVGAAEAHSNVGILQAQHGQIDEARKSLRKALELQSGLRQAQVVLARLDEHQ